MMPRRIALIAMYAAGGEKGGAERFYDGLLAALRERTDCNVDLVGVNSDERTFEAIEETYLRCYDLDVAAYDAVISTKSPSYLVRHPNHVCYLVHTTRVFYDMFDSLWPRPTPALVRQRDLIHKLDTGALSFPRTRKIFTIGDEVAKRLLKWNGLGAMVLHPGLGFDEFRSGGFSDYLFLPGRLHPWKRVDLVISAMKLVQRPVRLKIAGTGEARRELVEAAAGDGRIEFLGRVSDQELVDLYANCLAVPFVPLREDYGYVTLEAFRSGKPVITCSDSGEATHFVAHGGGGLVCEPSAGSIAEAIRTLYDDRGLARELGANGQRAAGAIRWERITPVLLESLGW